MDEWEALKAITINAAKICRVDHRVGSLAVGKDGDLVLWQGSPLLISSKVVMVFIEGKQVWPPEEG